MAYRKFTEDEIAMFLLQLEVLNYPENEHALSEVVKRKGAPSRPTLRRWWKQKNEPHINKLVQHKKRDFVEELKHLLGLHIDAAVEAVNGSEDIRAIDTGIGILVDKLQLLQGQPTERTDQRIIIERTGISTIPEHLARGTGSSNGQSKPLQRPGLRA